MSDETKPVESTPAAAPAAEASTEQPAETTQAPASSEPAAESKPVEETPAKTEEAPAEGAAAAAAPAEETKAAAKEVKPITSGFLSYKGAEKFPKNLLGHQRVFFWLGGDEAVPTSKLDVFLQHAKAEAHHLAAWSNQTGKGLLYFAKHDNKEHPTGIIPLADVSDISTVGTTEFTFKVNGQKHAFITNGDRERQGWLKSLKPEVETAKGKKEEITGSDGYKKTLESLKPAVVGASAAGAAGAASSAAKKSDERGTRDTNGTTKSQSRSVSRGKRGSIFDRLAGGKKDEVKEEVTGKKDEAKKDEPAKEEPAKDVPAETAAAAPAATEEAKKEEPKAEEPKKVEEPKKAEEPKQTRRGSRLGDFFKKAEGKSPVLEKKQPEAKPADTAPAVPPKDTEVPKTDDKKDEEAATAAVAAAPLPVVAGEEVKKEEPKKDVTTPKTEKKNFFDRFKPKEQPAKPAPATLKKEPEPSKPADTTEAAAATEPTTETEPAKTTEEAPAVNGEAKDTAARPSGEKQEKRRSSFFSGDIAGSLKKIGQKVEPKKSEEKPQTNGDQAKTAESAKDKPVETPAAAPASKKEKEENPLTKLGRRFSTAIRGVGKEPKKETPAAAKVEKTGESSEAKKTEEPAKTEETKPEETKPAEGEKQVNSIGDVVPEAVNVGSAPPANATVSATA